MELHGAEPGPDRRLDLGILLVHNFMHWASSNGKTLNLHFLFSSALVQQNLFHLLTSILLVEPMLFAQCFC